ncbi:MAG: hypothetical protein KU29_13875 [Sulfurovum sp. FS06-10]|nr:MAG: hypothetical protein KU29_13875 [Sulfurovum sp. FS06-10]
MKLLLSLMVAGATLFAGGDIIPIKVVQQKVVQAKPSSSKCYKPDIRKCPTCVDVAEICPYNGEDLPMAATEPCNALEK